MFKLNYTISIIIFLNLMYYDFINCVPIEKDFNYCEGLKVGLNFYAAQKAGFVNENSEFPWQKEITTKFDTYLNKKTNKDGNGYLSKGYFDAGDYLKITFPLAFSMTTLSWSFLEFEANIKQCNLTSSYLSTIKWGVDWLMAAHPEPNVIYAQCGHEVDHLSWSRADQIYNNNITGPRNCSLVINSENPSSDIAFEMVATMAATSIIFEKIDKEYSNVCKQHADELWNFGMTHPGINYNPMYPSNVSRDEQIWASAWMYLLYGPEYSFYKGFFENGRISRDDLFYNKWSQVYSWNNKMSAACILIAKNFNIYVEEANYLINSWNTKIEKTKDGLFFLDQWGNSRYALGGSFLESVWNNNKNSTAKKSHTNYAIEQMNIILGNNSNHHSYVSMFGFKGAKKTLNIHHRSSHSPPNDTDLKFHNILSPINNKYPIIGALLPGPIDLNDTYFEDRSRYEMNEPALDYNALFVGVMSSLINSKSNPVIDPISTLSCDSENFHRKPFTNSPIITEVPIQPKRKNTNGSDEDDTPRPIAPIFQDSNDFELYDRSNSNSSSSKYDDNPDYYDSNLFKQEFENNSNSHKLILNSQCYNTLLICAHIFIISIINKTKLF